MNYLKFYDSYSHASSLWLLFLAHRVKKGLKKLADNMK